MSHVSKLDFEKTLYKHCMTIFDDLDFLYSCYISTMQTSSNMSQKEYIEKYIN